MDGGERVGSLMRVARKRILSKLGCKKRTGREIIYHLTGNWDVDNDIVQPFSSASLLVHHLLSEDKLLVFALPTHSR